MLTPTKTPFKVFCAHPLLLSNIIGALLTFIIFSLGYHVFGMSVVHDTYKTFAYFKYFSESIAENTFPLWTPHSHVGEPFWPYIQYTGLLNPVYLLSYVLQKFDMISANSMHVFHYNVFFSILIFNVSLCALSHYILRNNGKSLYIYATAPLVHFGSMFLSAWSQGFGTILIATYAPLIIYLIIVIADELTKSKPKNLTTLLALLVATTSSQLNMGNPVFLVYALLIFFVFWLLELYLKKRTSLEKIGIQLLANWQIMLVSLTTIIMMASPMLHMIISFDKFIPVARLWSQKYYSDEPILTTGSGAIGQSLERRQLSNEDVGTPAEYGDFLFSLTGTAAMEIPLALCFGIFGLFLLLLGFVGFRRKLSLCSTLFFLIISLISLGDVIGLSTILVNHAPGFSAARHMEFFMIYAFVGSIMVISVGLIEFDALYNKLSNFKFYRSVFPVVVCSLAIFGLSVIVFQSVTDIKRLLMIVSPIQSLIEKLGFVFGASAFSLGIFLVFGHWLKNHSHKFTPKSSISMLVLLSIPSGLYYFGKTEFSYFFNSYPNNLTFVTEYRGQNYDGRRLITYSPGTTFGHYRARKVNGDTFSANGEPYLFYRDVVLHRDLAQVYTMPMKIFDFLSDGRKWIGQQDIKREIERSPKLKQLLGITHDKLQLIGKTHEDDSIQVLDYGPNTLSLVTKSENSVNLFYSQTALDGWQVTVNGQKVSSYTDQSHPFFQFELTAGKNYVAFNYKPKLVIWSLWMYVIGLVGCCAFSLLIFMQQKLNRGRLMFG